MGTEGDVKVPNSDINLCELNKCSVEAGRSTDSKTTSDASSREKSFRCVNVEYVFLHPY